LIFLGTHIDERKNGDGVFPFGGGYGLRFRSPQVEEEIDVQKNCDQDNERYQDQFQLEFPRLLPARKPSPD
jgi:hypothetical protein